MEIKMPNHDDQILIQKLMGQDAFLNDESVERYAYMLNPDGTIRWIYPASLKEPTFLNFYSTSSFRAKVLSGIIKFAFFIKQSHRIQSGELKLTIADSSRLGKVLQTCNYTGFSIFTGTVGENRKAVIEIHNSEALFMFVKIALTESAQALIRNEAKSLQYLNSYEFKGLVIPELLRNNEQDTIGLSNIKPKNFQQDLHLSGIHVKALSELYNISSTQKRWSELDTLQECKDILHTLLEDYEEVNTLDKSKVQKLSDKIVQLTTILKNDDAELTVAIAHGDFTPWNMYSANHVLHLFDWELSQSEMPLLYDLFHFIFQSEVMIKRSNYTVIYDEITKLITMKRVEGLLREFKIDLNKSYIFYLVYTITYYLDKYIKQKHLHEQVFWLMNVWEDAVNDAISNKGVVFEK